MNIQIATKRLSVSVKILPFVAVLVCLTSVCPVADADKMALRARTKKLDVSEKSVAILTFTAENKVQPSYHSICEVLVLANRNASGEKPKKHWTDQPSDTLYPFGGFKPDALQILSPALEPGTYTLSNLHGYARVLKDGLGNGVLVGGFAVEPKLECDVGKSEITYLGRLHLIIQPPSESGSLPGQGSIPKGMGALFSGRANEKAGFVPGAFSVEIRDAFDEDMSFLEKKYPWFDRKQVTKRLARAPQE